MSDNSEHITFFHMNPSPYDERRTDNYMIGLKLETLVRNSLLENFGLTCRQHFVTDRGPDAEFPDGVMEMINCKNYLTVSKPRFRRILQNLRRKRIKAVVCSYQSIFTKEQQRVLRKRNITIIEIGTQILPCHIWNKYTPEKRLGTKKSSKRNLKWVKNRILSGLLKIRELFLIYCSKKNIAENRESSNRILVHYATLMSLFERLSKAFMCDWRIFNLLDLGFLSFLGNIISFSNSRACMHAHNISP